MTGGAPAATGPGRKSTLGLDSGAPVVSAPGDTGQSDAGAGPAGPATPSSPSSGAAAPTEPVITLPQTAAEQAEGLPSWPSTSWATEGFGKGRHPFCTCAEKPSHLFKVENLTADVHAVLGPGFFEDVQVDLTTNDHGVVLRFVARGRTSKRTSPATTSSTTTR